MKESNQHTYKGFSLISKTVMNIIKKYFDNQVVKDPKAIEVFRKFYENQKKDK